MKRRSSESPFDAARTLLAAALALASCAPAWGVERSPRPERLLPGNANIIPVQPIDGAAWIWHPGPAAAEAPCFLRFRREFVSPGGTARVDISADERFVLLVDGNVVARGPDRGDVDNWQYATYDLPLHEGLRVVEVVAWRIGPAAPLAQLSWRGGFVMKADGAFDDLLTTGKACWRVGVLSGTSPDSELPAGGAWGGGSPFRVSGTGILDEIPASWVDAAVVRKPIPPESRERNVCNGGARQPGWVLYPSQLREQTEVKVRPGSFKLPSEGGELPARTFPPGTRTEILWDLENYYCAYPVLVVKGGRGAKVSWAWAEALRDPKTTRKARDRSSWRGLSFDGFTDEFVCDGRDRAVFTTPWFRCGRWVKLTVETSREPLCVEDAAIVESRYPLEDRSSFECGDAELDDVRALCVRGMQMCSHEMLFDCPFYEQQMYPGDTRVQLNVLQSMGADDALVRRIVDIFALARRSDGSIPMNWPTRGLQESMTFTMCQLMMYGDYAKYGADGKWLSARLNAMRGTLGAVEAFEDGNGLVAGLPGWSFMDWVPAWRSGVSPDGNGYPAGAVNNLFWALVRMNAAYVERALGNEERAREQEQRAKKTFAAVDKFFWDEKRGLYADTIRRDAWSEHAQCLALLSGLLPEGKAERVTEGLLSASDLSRCTVYFSYYLFEALFRQGRGDEVWRRLALWREYARRNLKTPLEAPDSDKPGEPEARSDCHGWGAHPLVWMQRGFAGVTSAAPFFRKVRVAPCPGPLKAIRSRTPHPDGFVETDLRFEDGEVSGAVTLPDGITGEFVWKGARRPLLSGTNDLSLPKTYRCEGTRNVRDCGGWKAADGKMVRIGRLIRSAALNASAGRDGKAGASRLTGNDRRLFVETLGVKTDLDLRSAGEVGDLAVSPLGSGVVWMHEPGYAYGKIFAPEARAFFSRVLHMLSDDSRYPVLIHCVGGADRTGTLVYLLNALLGVSEEDLMADWLRTAEYVADWRTDLGDIAALKEVLSAFRGATLREKAEAFFLACGAAREDIARFRRIMLEPR